MSAKNIGLLILWGVVAIFAALQIGNTQLTEFDPDLKFSEQISDINYDLEFVGLLAPYIGKEKAHIIHFEQGDCMCEWVAKSHKHKIDALGKMQGMPSITINLDVHTKFKELIPSTPSVAVIFNGQLRFLGPYSTGLGCLNSNGPVNEVLAYANRSMFANPVIIADAQGCYCNTTK